MKTDSGFFDVAMGAFHGAEVCDLVSNFFHHNLSGRYERNNLALYRDDGLAIFKNISGPASGKVKKYFCQLFRDHNPELTTYIQHIYIFFLIFFSFVLITNLQTNKIKLMNK